MSATKLDTSGVFSDSPESGQETLLTLPSNSFNVSKNGIEFQTSRPIADWTEMTVELEDPNGSKSVKCTGIVVGCNGLVSAVEIGATGGLPTEVVGCVQDTLRYAEFPAHSLPDGEVFEYPLNFSWD